MKDSNILISAFNMTDDCAQDFIVQNFDIPETHNRKFVETKKCNNFQVLRDNNWEDIVAIGKTIEYDVWIIKTNDYFLRCADKHIVFLGNDTAIYVDRLVKGDLIQTKSGLQQVTSIEVTNDKENMYDLELKFDSERRYFTNGILSHNSMWMQNMTVKAADQGLNVLFVSLEMGVQKCMKRMGAMRLKIPIKEYDDRVKDNAFMENRFKSVKNKTNGLFSDTPGKIFVKKFETGSCTPTMLNEFIIKLEKLKNIKLNMVIVDYISIMGIEGDNDFGNMLFLKGKHLAEGLRRIGEKHNLAVLTATQTDKAVWGANDIDLKNMPESKAIAETADSVWAIIRNPEMKKNDTYRLKILKFRDGEHKGEQIKFDFNTTFLNMENDVFYDVPDVKK